MDETASISATRSSSPTGHEPAPARRFGELGDTARASRSTRHSTPQRDTGLGGGLLLVAVVFVIAALMQAASPTSADAASSCRPLVSWCGTTATWYGPGFYGNGFACGGVYDERTSRGVAHMTLPCRSRLTICRGSRCVRVRVIDSGAFDPSHLDLTARTARDLIGCRSCKPYTQAVTWRRGWVPA